VWGTDYAGITRMPLPIRAKVTLVASGMMATGLVLVGLFIYLRFTAELTQTMDAGLSSRADQILGLLTSGGDLSEPGDVIEPDEAFAQVLSADGAILDASPGATRAALLSPPEVGLDGPIVFEASVRSGTDLVPARLLAVPGPDGQVVVVGASLEDQRDAVHHLGVLALIGGALAVALSSVIGWVMAGVALRPVDRMRRQADEISWSEPGERLSFPPTNDEIGRLGKTLNEMLLRLDAALLRERRFVGDASHELRTPLTNLKAEIEMALRRPRDEQTLRVALESAGDETDRLVRLAENLLVLARADHDTGFIVTEPVEVSELIGQVAAAFEARAESAHVDLVADVDTDLVAHVDPGRVRQAMDNLVDNAIRVSPTGSMVRMRAFCSGSDLMLEVVDSGPGFADGFVEQAFEPFSRADEGRARTDGGAGLGLAIVKAVAEAHDGSVWAVNRPDGGASVGLRLPLEAS